MYARCLRTDGLLSKQDMKDLEQMAGLRNAAAHGDFDLLSPERAGLLEQQVNLFLRRLAELLEPRVSGGLAERSINPVRALISNGTSPGRPPRARHPPFAPVPMMAWRRPTRGAPWGKTAGRGTAKP